MLLGDVISDATVHALELLVSRDAIVGTTNAASNASLSLLVILLREAASLLGVLVIEANGIFVKSVKVWHTTAVVLL